MSKSDLMDRVSDDLTRGHTQPALQRMHSLVAAHPTDLDLRRRLAAIYRLTGNLIEAGRWSYLDETLQPDEAAAFESAFPAHRRLAAVRWPAGVQAPTDHSRRRLTDLLAVRSALRPAVAAPGRNRFKSGLFLLATLALAACIVVGTATVIGWLR